MRSFVRHVVDTLGSAPLPQDSSEQQARDMTFRTACQSYVCMFEEAKCDNPLRTACRLSHVLTRACPGTAGGGSR